MQILVACETDIAAPAGKNVQQASNPSHVDRQQPVRAKIMKRQHFLWNTPATFKARGNQKGYRTIHIWEYPDNLQGQKRPGRIKKDSFVLLVHGCGHEVVLCGVM